MASEFHWNFTTLGLLEVCVQTALEGILAILLGWRRYQKAGNHDASPSSPSRRKASLEVVVTMAENFTRLLFLLASRCDYSVLPAITTPYVELNCRGHRRKVMQSIGFLGNLATSIRLLCSHSGLCSNHQDIGPCYVRVLPNMAGVLPGVLLQQLVLEQHIQQAVDQPDKSSMSQARPARQPHPSKQ
ncbi:hypothetical protein SELMODRAFT_406193 [Selaginella moellendorffii]|uniref:Uncharacterized protein n=1 Tax=Selaginella moellendorffii TaxID=88036 RepID=D8R1K5_SELML|nr:hypothetical protein SELMODRAFT_406193 [Selaginella moellendorffii]